MSSGNGRLNLPTEIVISYNCTLAHLTLVFVILAGAKECVECNSQVMNNNAKYNIIIEKLSISHLLLATGLEYKFNRC